MKGVPLLLELLEMAHATSGLTPGVIVERFRDRPEGAHLGQLLAEPLLVAEDAAPRVLADSLLRILALARDERMAQLLSKAEQGGLSSQEKEEFRQLQRDAAPGVPPG